MTLAFWSGGKGRVLREQTDAGGAVLVVQLNMPEGRGGVNELEAVDGDVIIFQHKGGFRVVIMLMCVSGDIPQIHPRGLGKGKWGRLVTLTPHKEEPQHFGVVVVVTDLRFAVAGDQGAGLDDKSTALGIVAGAGPQCFAERMVGAGDAMAGEGLYDGSVEEDQGDIPGVCGEPFLGELGQRREVRLEFGVVCDGCGYGSCGLWC